MKNDSLSAKLETDDSDTDTDLRKDTLSSRLEAGLIELVTDLDRDSCLAPVVAEPIPTPKFAVLPVKRELARVHESVNVLRYENFSSATEDAPIKMLKPLGKDLPTEPTALTEPERDLNSDKFLARTEAGPNVAEGDRKSDISRTNDTTEETELARVLKNEDFWAQLGSTVRDAINDRVREACLARPEDSVQEEVADLKSEVCSAKPEAGTIETTKLL